MITVKVVIKKRSVLHIGQHTGISNGIAHLCVRLPFFSHPPKQHNVISALENIKNTVFSSHITLRSVLMTERKMEWFLEIVRLTIYNVICKFNCWT